VGVRTAGYREILSARVADAEHELTWEGIFSDLKERGLLKVDLIISDGHTGIQSTAGRMFPGSSWQMCHVHFIRAVLRKVPREYHKDIAEILKECPNDASLIRLAGSILIDINDDWITGNRYLSVKSEMISLDTGCADFTEI
jgi:putative transposase